MLGKLFFVLAFVFGISFLAVNDPNNPMPEAALPVGLDDLAVESLLTDVPRISPLTIPETDPNNRTLLTAGIPIVEGLESFFRDLAEGATVAVYFAINAIVFALNIIIAVAWLVGKLIITLATVLRFDLWPAFQVHPITQIIGLMLTIGTVGAVVILLLLMILKVVGAVAGALPTG